MQALVNFLKHKNFFFYGTQNFYKCLKCFLMVKLCVCVNTDVHWRIILERVNQKYNSKLQYLQWTLLNQSSLLCTIKKIFFVISIFLGKHRCTLIWMLAFNYRWTQSRKYMDLQEITPMTPESTTWVRGHMYNMFPTDMFLYIQRKNLDS